MSNLGKLLIKKRTKVNSRDSKKLRNDGYLPGSISCKGKESLSVALKADDLRKNLVTYGRNALFTLSLDNDNSITAMVKEIQTSPLKGDMLHVDLQQVFLDTEIRAELSVRIKGVETLEFNQFMALRQLDDITVKGLPQNIPDEIVIDVTDIKEVENIKIADIKFPKGVVPENNLDQTVVSIVESKRFGENKDAEEDENIENNADENIESDIN